MPTCAGSSSPALASTRSAPTSKEPTMLEATGLELSYGATPALRGGSLSLAAGQRVALMGPSGCGKSSLLHVLCGVVRAGAGRFWVGDGALPPLPDRERSRIRLAHFGVVFQF